jgi:hypothetical protein
LTAIEFINDIFKHWIEQRIRNTMLSRMFPLYGWHIFYCALAYFSVVIGAFALLDLLLNVTMHGSSPFSVFGRGGTERMVAYPLLIWVIGFGGYLLGSASHMREQNKDMNHAVQCAEILYLFIK